MFVYRPDMKKIFSAALEDNSSFDRLIHRDQFESSLFVDKETNNLCGLILVPGFTKSDIKATFDSGYITVSGNTDSGSDLWPNTFKRRFAFDTEKFDVESVTFSVKDGVLRFSAKRKDDNLKTFSFEVK